MNVLLQNKDSSPQHCEISALQYADSHAFCSAKGRGLEHLCSSTRTIARYTSMKKRNSFFIYTHLHV